MIHQFMAVDSEWLFGSLLLDSATNWYLPWKMWVEDGWSTFWMISIYFPLCRMNVWTVVILVEPGFCRQRHVFAASEPYVSYVKRSGADHRNRFCNRLGTEFPPGETIEPGGCCLSPRRARRSPFRLDAPRGKPSRGIERPKQRRNRGRTLAWHHFFGELGWHFWFL